MPERLRKAGAPPCSGREKAVERPLLSWEHTEKNSCEDEMRKYLMMSFDVAVYGGFGLFLTAQVWAMPTELKERLVTFSWALLSALVG